LMHREDSKTSKWLLTQFVEHCFSRRK
jgi:hypothetical protein